MNEKSPFDDMMVPILSVDQLAELRQRATPRPALAVPQPPIVASVVDPANVFTALPEQAGEPFVPGYTPRKNGDPVDLTKMAAAIEPARHPELVAQFAATEANGPKPFSPDGAMAAIFDLENQVAELQRVVDAMRVRIGAA